MKIEYVCGGAGIESSIPDFCAAIHFGRKKGGSLCCCVEFT